MRATAHALIRSLADPGLLRLRAAAVTYVTVLLAGVIASLIAVRFDVGISIVVLAVMLSITFTAERVGTGTTQRLASLVVLPVAGIAAGSVAVLVFTLPIVGDSLFVLVVSGAIWLRRFGPVATRIGTLATLPFITVLVVPAPVGPGGGFALWAAAMALIVALLAFAVQWCARRIRLTPTPPKRTERTAASPARRSADSSGASAPTASKPTSTAAPTNGPDAQSQRMPASKRMPASTRMALQMALSLTAAFLLGHLVFGEHWFWTVLTAFIVASGNRGRGDVLYKGIHRTVGAAAGTVLATVLALFGSGAHLSGTAAGATVAAIAVILALGLWLRPAGYGWWAAAMTAMLSLLHELTGTAADSTMLIRMAAIVVGGVLSTAVAWWVLPVRTGDVLRRRTADALAALSALLAACIREPDAVAQHRATLDTALARLEQLGPTLRLERAVAARSRMPRRGSPRTPRETADAGHRADVIPAVRACRDSADAVAAGIEHGHSLSEQSARDLGALARRLGAYRRMLAGAQAPDPDAPTPEHPELAASLAGLRAPLSAIARPAA